MNVVPSVARPRVAGKNHAHQASFYRDRFTDFELRFVPAACDSSMWCLFQLSHCDAPDAVRTGRRGNVGEFEPPRVGHDTQIRDRLLCLCQSGELARAGLKDIEVVFDNAGLTLVTSSLTIDPTEA